jgi:hypothetical protein
VPAAKADLLAERFTVCFVDRAASAEPAAHPASCDAWEAALAYLALDHRERLVPSVDAAVERALGATFAVSVRRTLWYHLAAYLVAMGLVVLLPRHARNDEGLAAEHAGADAHARIGTHFSQLPMQEKRRS